MKRSRIILLLIGLSVLIAVSLLIAFSTDSDSIPRQLSALISYPNYSPAPVVGACYYLSVGVTSSCDAPLTQAMCESLGQSNGGIFQWHPGGTCPPDPLTTTNTCAQGGYELFHDFGSVHCTDASSGMTLAASNCLNDLDAELQQTACPAGCTATYLIGPVITDGYIYHTTSECTVSCQAVIGCR
ncbi:MAG: hypothetical protein WEA04_01495 [Candidatus Andersenbacteria bacterium]